MSLSQQVSSQRNPRKLYLRFKGDLCMNVCLTSLMTQVINEENEMKQFTQI